MPNRKERIEEINKKLARLRELKKKIEQKIKKEQTLALRYAKELAFCIIEAEKEAKESGVPIKSLVIKCLKGAICSRAKNQLDCLKRKLRLIVDYGEQFKQMHNIAENLLRHIENSEKEEA